MNYKAIRPIAIVLAFACGVLPARAAADVGQGKLVFDRQCALCHTIAKGAPNSYGPNLFAMLGRKPASVSGYQYSRAFATAAADWEWSPEVLASWVSSPRQMVPGSRMSVFQGVADRDRDNLLAYIAAQKQE
jgi:cytochrome c